MSLPPESLPPNYMQGNAINNRVVSTARPWRVFVRVTLPLTARALIAGLLINFTMNMAAFATPALLGGTRARVLSFVAYQVNLETLNWPLGGAMAVVLLALSLAIVWLAQRLAPSPAGTSS